MDQTQNCLKHSRPLINPHFLFSEPCPASVPGHHGLCSGLQGCWTSFFFLHVQWEGPHLQAGDAALAVLPLFVFPAVSPAGSVPSSVPRQPLHFTATSRQIFNESHFIKNNSLCLPQQVFPFGFWCHCFPLQNFPPLFPGFFSPLLFIISNPSVFFGEGQKSQFPQVSIIRELLSSRTPPNLPISS